MRTICVGDVHGCIDELNDLLEIVSPSHDDRIVMLGDLVDRGPDSLGVVRRCREIGATLVLGNHEETLVRRRMHEARRAEIDGYKNPMRPIYGERQQIWDSLSEEDWSYLEGGLARYDFGLWTAVHAGFEAADVHPLDQDRKVTCRVRYLDPETGRISKSAWETDDVVFWTQMCTLERHIVYGHQVQSLDGPVVDLSSDGYLRVSLDTGCVFGGRLSALIVGDDNLWEITSVPARQNYFGD